MGNIIRRRRRRLHWMGHMARMERERRARGNVEEAGHERTSWKR